MEAFDSGLDISLTPEMILGLLSELRDSDTPYVLSFRKLLKSHPVARPGGSPSASLSMPDHQSGDESLETSGSRPDPALSPSAPVIESGPGDNIGMDASESDRPAEALVTTEGGEEGLEGGPGKICCRNGTKRVALAASSRPRRQPQEVGQAGSGGTAPGSGNTLVGNKSEEESGERDNTSSVNGKRKRQYKKAEKSESTGRTKRSKRDGPPKWLTDGSPPSLVNGTDEFIIKLCGIISNTGLQSMVDFVRACIRTDTVLREQSGSEYPPLSLGDVISACARSSLKMAVAGFDFMISVIRLAFHFDRELARSENRPTVAGIARLFKVNEKTLWYWYNQGSHLIHLASGGTFYILIFIASLGLTSEVIKRDVTVDLVIDSVSFALRNPEFSGLTDSLIEMVNHTIIPQIRLLRNFEPLRPALRFDIFPSGGPNTVLDFFDIKTMDALGDSFQTNLFRLPARSDMWSTTIAEPTSVSSFSSADGLHPAKSIIPVLREAIDIVTPLDLSLCSSPNIEPKTRKAWTRAHRLEVEANGVSASSIDHLTRLMREYHKGGTRRECSYVKVPRPLIEDKTVKFSGAAKSFIALVSNEAADLVKDRLSQIQRILQNLDPQNFEPCNSRDHSFTFDSIHFDTYNRFAEKGDGAPKDVHPHFIYKEHHKHFNHSQRGTYMAKAIKDNPEQFDAITTALEDVCKIVYELIHKHLPEVHDHLRVFCEILPLNRCPVTYPFPGFVLNIRVCTEAHVDANDDTICVVIPFGPHEGGEIVLYEAGLVLDLKGGDILIFPSYRITHFNLHFVGVRCSIVLHSDKDVKSWNFNRNGWDSHMVVKR